MNILIVCPRLCHGGAERVAVSLANGFADRGHEIRFMADLFEEQTYELDKRITLLNLVSTASNKLRKWSGAISLIRKETKRNRPDVIIGIMELCSFVAKIATFDMGIPVVATEHSPFEHPQNAPMSKIEKFYKFYLNKIFDHVTVLTETDKKVIGNKLRNIIAMPNPLAIEPATSLSSKEKIVLAAGRVDNWHYKGFDVLIKAWKKIQDFYENDDENENLNGWWLKIAGVWRGEETIPYLTGLLPDSEFRIQVLSNGNKTCISQKYHVEFLGFQNDMENLYKKSSIFVLSSRYEAFGLVLIEAMSQGCAPVACDYKGRQREILSPSGDERRPPCDKDVASLTKREVKTKDEKSEIEITENGILCEPDNVETLAAGMKKMVEDEDYRKKVQRNAIERSKFYNKEHTMDRWEEYLKIVIS